MCAGEVVLGSGFGALPDSDINECNRRVLTVVIANDTGLSGVNFDLWSKSHAMFSYFSIIQWMEF